MVPIKSHIKRNIKPKHYPENVCFESNEIYYKCDEINLNEKEEVLFTIDNDPHSEQADGVIFTTERLIVFAPRSVKSILWKQIESYKLPKNKFKEGYTSTPPGYDRFMAVSDTIVLHLKGGESVTVRIIYGGIYTLATLLGSLKHHGHFD